MKIKILLVIVCCIAFGLSALAQRLNNSYSRDTVLKDGNIIIGENIRTELQKIPIPAGVDARFYKKIVNAVQHQKEIAISTLSLNLFFQLEKQIRLYRYDNKNEVWNPLLQTRHEKNNIFLYVAIFLIIFDFFAGRQSNIKMSELFSVFTLTLIVGLISFVILLMYQHYTTTSVEIITDHKELSLQLTLNGIGLALLSALAIFMGRAFSRKEETDENLTWV
ncbi:hypothetical protein K8Q96_02160 [Candidatus Nomurabacteria bacterium]|nr:hypothetical protein [Candidatus Nomurabacteria bacterium]